ncbi:MAG: mycothiol system anti-sigma-R factor [Flammeovirgaceae bacterium]|nr:mycothiol system anti-sigma-R factor [Flammeovirgaceae bacterium]
MTNQVNPFILADGKKPSCMEMLQLILDGEATGEQQTYFKSHMDKCAPCFKSYDLDNTIKELLKTRCCGDSVPAGLVEQIKNQISLNKAS